MDSYSQVLWVCTTFHFFAEDETLTNGTMIVDRLRSRLMKQEIKFY